MKTQKSRRPDGFTLVELLVVIAIIAVLAGAGFAAGNAAIQKAKRTTAQATCVSLESAVNNFFTEYGSMPVDNLTADTTVNTRGNLSLIQTLLGQETGTAALNPRAIKFLQVREGKSDKNGMTFNPSGGVVGLFDPWGGPYFIAIDGDYDERVTATPVGSPQRILNGRRSAVWSNGADAGRAGTEGNAADNVITW